MTTKSLETRHSLFTCDFPEDSGSGSSELVDGTKQPVSSSVSVGSTSFRLRWKPSYSLFEGNGRMVLFLLHTDNES